MAVQPKVPDETLIESYRRTASYTITGREVGLTRRRTKENIKRLRAQGVELPDNKTRGWVLKELHAEHRKAVKDEQPR